MIEYNFCPKCSQNITRHSGEAYCANCKITYYRNSKPCASVLPIKDGKVLVARRAADPFKGDLDIIGGFMEYGEDPKAAAIREAKEETGLDIKITALLGIYTDTYGENGDATLNIHYLGEIVSGEPKAESDVSSLEWIAIKDLPETEGFKNTRKGFRDLKKLYMN